MGRWKEGRVGWCADGWMDGRKEGLTGDEGLKVGEWIDG